MIHQHHYLFNGTNSSDDLVKINAFLSRHPNGKSSGNFNVTFIDYYYGLKTS
jgi:hypothetical protein